MESFAKFEQKVMEKRIPIDVSFELTHRCNTACRICYQSHEAQAELNTRQIKTILDKLAKAGCLFLTITGGEPTLRDDLIDILDYATDQGFVVTLKTNGTLINEQTAKSLKKCKLKEVHISLLAGTASIHDQLTGIPSSFNKTIKAIKLLTAEKIRVQIMSVITRGNIEQINKIENLAQELKVHDYMFDSFIFPGKNKNQEPLDYRLTDSELKEFFKLLKIDPPKNISSTCNLSEEEQNDDLFFSCRVGRSGFTILPSGEVIACSSLPIALGNAHTHSIQSIINSPKIDQIIEAVRLRNNHACWNCHNKFECFRCPGLAYLENGSTKEAPKEACRQFNLKKEVLYGNTKQQ